MHRRFHRGRRPLTTPAATVITAALLIALIPRSAKGDERLAEAGYHAADLQLARLIHTLLDENPGVKAMHSRWQAGLQRVAQSRALPDPRVAWRFHARTPETRVGPQRQGVEISQAVPWFGKRELQARQSARLADGLQWQAQEVERQLVMELKRQYFSAGYLQEALAVNADEKALLERFEQIALTRYSTGKGIQQSVLKVQTEITRLADQKTFLAQELDATLIAIQRLLGQRSGVIELELIALPLLPVDLDAERLAAEAATSHPTVQAVRQRIEAGEARVERRRLDSRPDFRFGIGYTNVGRRDDPAGILAPPEGNGDDILTITVGLDIPLYRKRIHAGTVEARQGLDAQRWTLRDLRNRLRHGIRETIVRLEALDTRARLYEEVLIPQAEESLASAEAAYTTNRQVFLDLLDAERTLFQARLTSHRLLADFWIALAEMEEQLGRPFPGLQEQAEDPMMQENRHG